MPVVPKALKALLACARLGAINRATMVKIADGTPWKVPAAIDDPAILDEITAVLKSLGPAQGA